MHRNRNLLIVTFISFINAMSISLIVPIIYVYGKKYGLTDFEASLLLTIFSAAQFFATPVIGRLSDYFGRKPLLAISIFGTALSNLLAAFAPSAAVLFIARALDGITGGNNSVAAAVISDSTPPADRGKAFGLFGASFGLAFIIGPFVSLFLQKISLEAPYLVSAGLALLATLITIFFLPETLKKVETKPLNAKSFGFLQVFKGLTIPVIGSILVANFLATLVFGIFTYAFQPYLINSLKFGTTEISMILVVFGSVSMFIQTVILRKLLKRFSLVRLLMVSLLGTGLSCIAFLVPQQFPLLLLVCIFFATSSAIGRPVINALIANNSKPEDQGIALGLSESYFSLANTLGPVVGGLIIAISYQTPLYAAGAVGIIGFIFVYLHRNKIHDQAAAKEQADF